MRILLDGSLYLYAPSGGGFRYLNELIPRLGRYQGVELTVLSPRQAPMPSAIADSKVELKRDMLPSVSWFPQGQLRSQLGRVKRGLESALLTLREIPKERAIFHSIFYFPPPLRGVIPVYTIHDMIPELFRDRFRTDSHQVVRERKKKCLETGRHFIAVSECTKRDLCRIGGVTPDRVTVVPHGVDADFFSRAHTPNDEMALRRAHGIDGPFLLFVGGRLHHKNFARLLEAYGASTLKKDFKLVVAGGAWSEDERALLSKYGIESRVILVPDADDATLRLLYRLASVFVFPSLYEGFGLPLLEAMAAGGVIAAAKASCFPEIAGEAVEYFDPEDPSSLVRAVETALDPHRAQALRSAGQARVKQFTWEETTRRTVEAYRVAFLAY